MTDKPIAYAADGRALYDNTPTVVAVVVVGHTGRTLVVRRGNTPGYGLLALPGGYHMRGESWQEAGARAVFEETGAILDPKRISLMSMDTDEYGNNLIIATAHHREVVPITDGVEILEALWVSDVGLPSDWAFPRHYNAAVHWPPQ